MWIMLVFKVWSADRKVRKMVVAENYEDLMEKGYPLLLLMYTHQLQYIVTGITLKFFRTYYFVTSFSFFVLNLYL